MEFSGERYMPSLSGEIAYEHMNRYYFVINQLNLKNKKILDIASGEGYGANLLAESAAYVYGVDISIEAVAYAKNKYKKENLTFIAGDAVAIPLETNSVDIVVSFETIEHLDKHQEMINEIKRVLRLGGILIISSPDKLSYSDKSNDVNNFHVKELYSDEFKLLINNNFNKTIFFNQKIFVGSLIVSDEEDLPYKKPLIVEKNGKTSFLEPKYNIAIATDNINISLNYPMICYTEMNKIIIKEELMHANYEGQRQVSNSLSYKLGATIINPFKKISNAISTLLSL